MRLKGSPRSSTPSLKVNSCDKRPHPISSFYIINVTFTHSSCPSSIARLMLSYCPFLPKIRVRRVGISGPVMWYLNSHGNLFTFILQPICIVLPPPASSLRGLQAGGRNMSCGCSARQNLHLNVPLSNQLHRGTWGETQRPDSDNWLARRTLHALAVYDPLGTRCPWGYVSPRRARCPPLVGTTPEEVRCNAKNSRLWRSR